MYLAGLSETLGLLLLKLIEDHANPAVRMHLVVLAEEGAYTAALLDDMQRLREVPSSTERDALTKVLLGAERPHGSPCRVIEASGHSAG